MFYPGETNTPSASITTIKCLLSSVVTITKAGFIVLDIKYFYLNTTMKRKEYMSIHK